MQAKGKERAAKCERRPSLKPASVQVRSVPLFQAEEVGVGTSTALPRHPAESAGHSWERNGKGTNASFREEVIPHTTHSKVHRLEWFGSSQSPLQVGICMCRFPVGLCHHLLHYTENAVEMDEAFCDLLHIMELKALKPKRFHREGICLSC